MKSHLIKTNSSYNNKKTRFLKHFYNSLYSLYIWLAKDFCNIVNINLYDYTIL